MQATAQPDADASSVPVDLNPPVRAESIDLRVLIRHRTATQANASHGLATTRSPFVSAIHLGHGVRAALITASTSRKIKPKPPSIRSGVAAFPFSPSSKAKAGGGGEIRTHDSHYASTELSLLS